QMLKLSELSDFYTLDNAAEMPDEEQEEEVAAPIISDDQRGLHAKLMILENGWQARLLTGSANATDAAFNGRNVELMVELTGPRKICGINSLLGEEGTKHTLRSMLRPYRREHGKVPGETAQKKIEKQLDEARRRISDAALRIEIEPETTDEYCMILRMGDKGFELPRNVTGCFYPISLGEVQSKNLLELTTTGEMVFDKITSEALTSFMAFELIGRYKSDKLGASFVLNLPVTGMPADRDRRILKSILKDRDRFIRYLMLILGNDPLNMVPPIEGNGNNKRLWHYGSPWGLPLLEELVRAFSRDPDKILRVERLIKDLKAVGGLEDVLPEGFDDIWEAFKGAQTIRRYLASAG
ncbi:MAG: phospholipase D family protein, partial [Syntrophaceae bacterium]|nr:phospholipase D family protein [Syntrophaceae bacterium]